MIPQLITFKLFHVKSLLIKLTLSYFLLFSLHSGLKAEALDLYRKTGIGFSQSNGGVQGLALSYGLSKIIWAELILGGSLIQEENQDSQYQLGGAAGFHIQLIQAKDKAFLSLGLRWNTLIQALSSEDCTQSNKICSLTTHIIDIPLRIHWFAMANLSFFSEFGASLQLGNGKSGILGSSVNQGYQLDLFQNRLPFGLLGLALWF